MLKTSSPTGLSTILQLIDVSDKDDINESGGNGTNLSNPSISTRSTGAGYLSFGGTKKGGGNIKKDVKAAKGSDYLTPAAKKAFNYLRHAFILEPILQHFDLEQHIQIEINTSGYTIGGVLSKLTLDDLSRWHLVAYYLQKMFSAKTWYKTHNGEFLAIVKAFKP